MRHSYTILKCIRHLLCGTFWVNQCVSLTSSKPIFVARLSSGQHPGTTGSSKAKTAAWDAQFIQRMEWLWLWVARVFFLKPLSTVNTIDNQRMKYLWCWNVYKALSTATGFCVWRSLECWKCWVELSVSQPDWESLAADQGMMCWSSLWRVQPCVKTIRINGASQLSKGVHQVSLHSKYNRSWQPWHTFLGLPWGKFPVCLGIGGYL